MLAMNYRGPFRVRIERKPYPEILHPQDAIVRVTLYFFQKQLTWLVVLYYSASCSPEQNNCCL
jgi:hypothetical protein